ncbi:hypothetical protein DAETH_48850 (plasmid) [Deinococcus aetherius]|uniref:Response regulatory domain-containing protein n=1 Tax=Deinococcus aetherius TaxID=200252 RepID=A0ABN6RR78_9DEIO|nr:hypothetical protein DAETH_48850 [Deinococcus aetherius]
MLLDVNMPAMTGFEVLQAVKLDPQLGVIPVVMLTTSDSRDDITRAYTLHASSYLLKSVDFAGFIAQVESFVAFWSRSRLVQWPDPSGQPERGSAAETEDGTRPVPSIR